jgi:hypothetical protein
MHFEKHIHYTIDVLLQDVLEIDGEIPVQVYYGHEVYGNESSSIPIIQIVPSDFFTKEVYLSADSLPQSPISWVEASKFLLLRVNFFEKMIPVLYWGDRKRQDVVIKRNNVIVSMPDIIASTFFMITRYEETIIKKRDVYDRFPASQSVGFREGFLHRPIIHEYAEILWDWIKTLVPTATRKEKAFKLRLTHDIDRLRLYTSLVKEVVGIPWRVCVKGEKFSEVFLRIIEARSVLSGKREDPYMKIEHLMNISEEYGVCSCFYFMTDNLNRRYKISEKRFRETIENILLRGHEVGLHPNFGSYISYKKLARQKDNLDKILGYKEYGARQHYLQWKVGKTWRLYEEVGLTHDSSVGFLDMAGFRSGICVPYRVFDPEEGEDLSLSEIPLIVMDASVYSRKYDEMRNKYVKKWFGRSLREMSVLDHAFILKRQTKKNAGCFTVLWHNSSLNKSKELDYRDLVNNDWAKPDEC